MQSFINAGYTSQEVELAARKVSEAGHQAPAATKSAAPTMPQQMQRPGSPRQLPRQAPLVVEKKSHRVSGVIIGLLIALGLIIVALILLYVFQDAIF